MRRSTVVGLLGLVLLCGFLAWESRQDGPAAAFAASCDSDGDGEDDGVIIRGRCRQGPGGGGEEDPAPEPDPGPRNGTFTETTYTAPCGTNSPDSGDYDCMASRSCPDWPEERASWEWQRDVTYTDGRVTNTGPWVRQGTVCRSTTDEEPQPTPEEVREAVLVLLPKADPEVAPPGGRTLINFDTVFYTEIDTYVADVQVVGQQVTVRAVPERFEWHFGDGGTLTTDKKGGPYPNMDIVHRYAETGTFAVDVDVSYQAEFRVGNAGPWQPIPGLITIDDGPSVQLAAVESDPVLKRKR